MRPHKDSDDLGRLAHGCFWSAAIVLIIGLAIAVACRTLAAQQPTAVYLPIATYIPTKTGVAWCVDCPVNADKLGAYYHYACCSICPPPGSRQIPILRPGTFWADCPADYSGYMLVGNEGEFAGQDNMTPSAMAGFIVNARAEHPEAIFVCLNSYDLSYATAVLALLPAGACEIIGVHIYDDVDIGEHLAPLQGYRLWVTEVGFCDPAVMSRVITEILAHPDIERYFGYTAVNGVNPCLDMIRDDELTAVGLAFKSSMEAYP